GLQVAAYLDGELVLDAWAGLADAASGAPVTADTLFLAYSCSKGVTSTVIHQLAEAGKLDYDTPVASYWPEFAARGKGAITLRHILTHQAGIPHLPLNLSLETVCDEDAMRELIAGLTPRWRPGLRTAYHGITMGPILGEVIARVTGQTFREVVAQSIAQPLGLEDFFFGVPPAEASRLARLCGAPVPWTPLPRFFLVNRVIPRGVEPGLRWNCAQVHQIPMPAGNLVTSARSLARHYAALCPAGADGIHLLPPERIRQATALQTRARDHTMFWMRIPKGLGYWLGGGAVPGLGPRQTVFGHTGAGGTIGFADPDQNFSFALFKNQMSFRGSEDTDVTVMQAVRRALGLKA
ncbi:MAG TPA: serine hydrolase domain-containing protein, partial [Candidatus Obscuribacterales bacterium]